MSEGNINALLQSTDDFLKYFKNMMEKCNKNISKIDDADREVMFLKLNDLLIKFDSLLLDYENYKNKLLEGRESLEELKKILEYL